MATWASPLARASWRSFSLFYKRGPIGPTSTLLCVFLLVFLLCCSSSFTTIHTSLFLVFYCYMVFCCSSFVFCCCVVFHYYSSFVFCCCTMFHRSSMLHYSLAHLGTFLPLVNLLFLYASLLPCLDRYFPPSFLFYSVLEIWNCLGRSLKASN